MDLLVHAIAVPFGYVCDVSGFNATDSSSDLQDLNFEMGESCRNGMQGLPDVITSSFQDLVPLEAIPTDNSATRDLSRATSSAYRQRTLCKQQHSEVSLNTWNFREDLWNILLEFRHMRNMNGSRWQIRQSVDGGSQTHDGFTSDVNHHRFHLYSCHNHRFCNLYLWKKFSFDVWLLLSSACFRCGGRHVKLQGHVGRAREGLKLRTIADQFHEDYAKIRSKNTVDTAFKLTIPSAFSKSLAASILLIYCWRIFNKIR